MGNPTFNTRIQHKRGTAEDWSKAINFVPFRGELIIYDTPGTSPKIKIGDGETVVNDLSFANDFENTIIGVNIENKVVEKKQILADGTEDIYSVNAEVITYTFGDGRSVVSTTANTDLASETAAGVVYLFNSTGSSTKGAMTQKAITNELVKKAEASVNNSTLIFTNTTLQ